MGSPETIEEPAARAEPPLLPVLTPMLATTAPFTAIGARTAINRPRKYWALLALLVSGAVALTYYLFLARSVEVVQPHRGPATLAVYATGTVEPTVSVPIAARTGARLVELNVDEGDAVRKGQVLARLENDDLRRAIEMAAAEERYAKAALDRQAALVGRQVVSRSAYDRAEADWAKAKAAREQAASQSSYLELIAPADGTVIRRDGEVGQMIVANQTVFWLSCCAPLRISAEVDEEEIAQVRPGQQVLIRSDDFPGKIFTGEVQAVTPKGDPVARTYRVRIALPTDTPLMIGMTTETNIVLHHTDTALLLPASAVRQDTVWSVEAGHAVQHHVEVGAKGATEVEIVSGIGDGDWIVAAPAADLKRGQNIRARPATPR